MIGRPKSELSIVRAAAYPLLSLIYLLLTFGLPLLLCVLLYREAGTRWQWLALIICPILYAIVFAGVAGLLSIPHHKGVIAGKFPRNVAHRVYFHRRLYGLCWTALFYFKPVYFTVLTIDPVRKCVFRLFGYRGSLNFTIYPDSWIRDLPLLNFGDGAYVANRSTLGSNICLQSGEILVGAISIGERSVLGHLSVIGLDSRMDSDSELGVGVTTGMQVRIGRMTKVGAISGLNHGSSIGDRCEIGAMSYVGSGTRILDGVELPAASVSADHLVIEDDARIVAAPPAESKRDFSDEDKVWLGRPDVRSVLDVIRTITKSSNSAYHPDDSLGSLQLDSLGRIELLVALAKTLGNDIEDRVVVESHTIRELVDRLLNSGSSSQDHGRAHPVFDSPLSSTEARFFEESRTFSAPLWFLIGRGIELLGSVCFGLEVQGRERLPQSGPFILCANHQSYLDPPCILSVLPWRIYKNVFIIGTSEIFGKGIMGILARTVRLFPVDPNENPQSAMRVSARGLKQGMGLLLYPEGERSIDGELRRFKKGAGVLAANLKVPIYPLAIDGFHEAWPRGKGFAKFAKLKMKFGDPIYVEESIDPKFAEERMLGALRDSITTMLQELRSTGNQRNETRTATGGAFMDSGSGDNR